MTKKTITYQDLPNSVKYGLGFLFSGWILFLIVDYVFLNSFWFLEIFIVLGILSYYIIRIRDWARVLALLFNVIGTIYCTTFSLAFLSANFYGSFLFLIIAVLMGGSTFFLIKKESSHFYKINTPGSHKNQPEKEKRASS